jgi:propionyl-CoA carboxylase alpha chain
MVSKLLVANRGEIARRIFRTCREMGIATVAIHSTVDRGQPHVAEADSTVELPGATPAETYLDIAAVIEAARRSGADAVHPGYGFLSENAAFATAVIESGLTWIGPPSNAIRLMGSKVEARRLMEKAGVPVLTAAMTMAEAQELPFPLLVKASAGGGGKGMRIVSDPADLEAATSAAQREAGAAFGDDTVFFERYLEGPRHIEVQVFGDRHGKIVAFHERECSIQRRHQKIIEEAPSPAVDEAMRDRLAGAAVGAARAVSYEGAGTVEFIAHDDEFWFLEMNTRLQVEHPVTEMITGLDLVRLQIEVAQGGRVPDPPPISGHAIEARLYAEDPTNEFLPVSGLVETFEFDATPGVRVDSGVESRTEVSVHYDPLIAKVIAHAETREQAAGKLAGALRGARIHGPVNNRALLVGILEHPEFLAGATDTAFLERHDPVDVARPLLDESRERQAAVAAALADIAAARGASVLPSLPPAWRNTPSSPRRRTYRGDLGTWEVEYQTDRDGQLTLRDSDLSVGQVGDRSVEIGSDGDLTSWLVTRSEDVRWVDSDHGGVRLVAVSPFPQPDSEEDEGSLHAPMPGKIVRVAVSEGDRVSDGQVLVVIEAMKMEHSLRAPHGGTVAQVRCRAGDQVSAGAVLVVVE